MGNTYVTGRTASPDFPTVNPLVGAFIGTTGFVAKLNANGSALVYSTYLGKQLGIFGIAVDSAGSAYVTGAAGFGFFPTVNPLQGSPASENDAFVAKLNPNGSAFVYSTFLGGSGYDFGSSIAVDSTGNAYVTGETDSIDFPTVNPLQGELGQGIHIQDAFVAKLNAAGSALVYSTYLGGENVDRGVGIAVDSAGNAYVTGDTISPGFPIANPLQSHHAGGTHDAFVSKLNATGSALIYSTYLGGRDDDVGSGIAVDSVGNAYVVGATESLDFPTVNPVLGRVAGVDDAFVTKLNVTGSLAYSTFLGGGHVDRSLGIAVDNAGNAHVTGITQSPDFLTANPLQETLRGIQNAFVAKIGDTAPPPNIECLLDWAQTFYPSLFSPLVSGLQFFSPYTYRYYKDTNAYVGVSSTNNHVYYQGPDGVLQDVGDLSAWLTTAGCRVVDAQTLIQSLITLNNTISGKIDADLATVVTAFSEAKDINRSLFWADWAKLFLVVIEDTIKAISDILSLFGTNLAEFQVKATLGISEAEGFVKTFSWIQTLQGLWDTGTQLQLAIDGPAYTSAIENMIEIAERVACGVLGCAINFNQVEYETVIRNYLTAPGILVVPHRTSDIQRRKFEVVQGINQAKGRISNRLKNLIDALSGNPIIPSDFPLQETIRSIDALSIKIKESKSQGVDLGYETLLTDGSNIVNYTQSVTLGRIAALERNRVVALGLFDENAFLEQIITINAAQDAIVKASVLQMQSVYRKFGEPGVPPIELPLFKTHSLLTTGIEVSISSLQKQDGINARDLINQVPQDMVMVYPDELSDLWMVTDDVVNTINIRLNR
jgi:hypothetical protein